MINPRLTDVFILYSYSLDLLLNCIVTCLTLTSVVLFSKKKKKNEMK